MNKRHIVYILCFILLIACIPLARMRAVTESNSNQSSVSAIQVSIDDNKMVDTGQKQNITVQSTFSKVDNYETMYYRIDMAMDSNVSLATLFSEDGTYTVIQNGTQVVLHLSEDQSYIWYSLKAGETVSFGLDFMCPNGISGDYNKVQLAIGVADSEEKIKNNEVQNYDSTVAEWGAEFGWQPVEKSVNESYIKLNEDNKLTEDLTYHIMAAPDDQGNVNTGRIWTETLTFNDTLNLPEGITIPEGARIEGNTIKNAAGEVLFEIEGLPENSECNISISKNQQISFTAKIHNNSIPTKELDNTNLTIHLAASKLEMDSTYQWTEDNSKITNNVHLLAEAYNSNKTSESSDDVVTIITEKKPEIVITKEGKPTSGESSVKAGETINYTITVKNQGTLEATGKTVIDTLPVSLTLTEVQIAAITATGATVVINEEGRYVISWYNQMIPANGSKTYSFQATVKDAKELAELKVDTITNEASVDSTKVFNNVPYDKPELKVSKSHDTIGSLEDGAIIPYTITVKNSNTETLYGVIATDTLPKGLVLLDQNQSEVITSGTYMIGDKQAKVIVNSDGTTSIVWNLGDMKSGEEQSIQYQAKLVEAKLDQALGHVTLTNRVDINYGGTASDRVEHDIVGVVPDKKINDNGTEKESSVVEEGQQVTYYLYLKNEADHAITVKDVTDTLPDPQGSFSWKPDAVEITKQGTNADFCTYSTNTETPYTIRFSEWGDRNIVWPEITVQAHTTLKQEIKVTFPAGVDWENYVEALKVNASWLKSENKLSYTGGKTVTVNHTIKEEPVDQNQVYMQKGVYQLGQKINEGNNTPLAYGSDAKYQGISRKYYTKEDGYVSYYFFVSNTGKLPVTIKNAVDILPQGIIYENMVSDYNSWHVGGYYDSNVSKNSIRTIQQNNLYDVNYTSVTGDTVTYKGVTVNATYEQQTGSILFEFSKDGEPVILKTGEAICFVYNCSIDGETALESGSTNHIAIPFEEDVAISEKLKVTQNNKESSKKASKNDGDCTKVTSENSGKYQSILNDDNTYHWLESKVTILPGNITPGLQKYATQYQSAGGTIYNTITDQTSLSPTDMVKWEITASNYEGLDAIKDYTITDSMQYPYEINKAELTIYNEKKEKLLDSEVIRVPESKPIDNQETKEPREYTFRFKEEKYKIPSGGYAVLTIYTKQPIGLGVYSTFQNEATFGLSQDFTIFDVTDGEQGRDENGKITITNRDTITVAGVNSTKSVKRITEKEKTTNTAAGNKSGDEKNYIVIPSVNSTIRYSLQVTNTSSKPLTSFVVIDALPELGDTGVLDTYTQRGSQFPVYLAEDPDIVVSVIDTDGKKLVLGNGTYQIEYSKETSYTEEDWQGTANIARWSNEADSDTRSVRVVIPEEVILYAGQSIEIEFDATVSPDALQEQMAWNSFGYKYYTTNEVIDEISGKVVGYKKGTTSLAAAPPKVGVKLQGSANIQKIVLDSDGTPLPADDSKSFVFQIYQGKVSQSELENKTPYKEITLTQGGMISLADYLDPGKYYTITEVLAEDGTYHLVNLYQNSDPIINVENCYQFYYTGEDSFTIIATNQKEEELCSITIEKIEEPDGESQDKIYLSGATFLLERQLQDGTWEKVDEVTTPDSGKIQFDMLPAGMYRITEVKAPSGYQKLQNPFVVTLPYTYQEGDIIQGIKVTESGVANDITITVTNAKVSILPLFGGGGTAYSLYLGLAMMAIAAILIKSKINKNNMKKGEEL